MVVGVHALTPSSPARENWPEVGRAHEATTSFATCAGRATTVAYVPASEDQEVAPRRCGRTL